MKNNMKEFKVLIERYNTITLEEIEAKAVWVNDIARSNTKRNLTGFGSFDTCTLCVRAKQMKEEFLLKNGEDIVIDYCDFCIWKQQTGHYCTSMFGYSDIQDAKTSQELLDAYRIRAQRMKELLENIELG